METEVTTNNQDAGQLAQQESQEDSNVDYKALYLDEVQNSKKLRKRSQEAEAKITEFTTAQETNKVKQMKKQEMFRELSEELQKKLDSVSPYKEKWEEHETAQREMFLSKLPKADREKFANESLQVLEYMTDKLNESTAQPTQHKPGATRVAPLDKPWSEMTEEEKRSSYDQRLKDIGVSR
jgi:hypothetical protein